MDDKEPFKIHGIISSDSDSDIETKRDLDEEYNLYKPPPFDYELMKNNLIKISCKEPEIFNVWEERLKHMSNNNGKNEQMEKNIDTSNTKKKKRKRAKRRKLLMPNGGSDDEANTVDKDGFSNSSEMLVLHSDKILTDVACSDVGVWEGGLKQMSNNNEQNELREKDIKTSSSKKKKKKRKFTNLFSPNEITDMYAAYTVDKEEIGSNEMSLLYSDEIPTDDSWSAVGVWDERLTHISNINGKNEQMEMDFIDMYETSIAEAEDIGSILYSKEALIDLITDVRNDAFSIPSKAFSYTLRNDVDKTLNINPDHFQTFSQKGFGRFDEQKSTKIELNPLNHKNIWFQRMCTQMSKNETVEMTPKEDEMIENYLKTVNSLETGKLSVEKSVPQTKHCIENVHSIIEKNNFGTIIKSKNKKKKTKQISIDSINESKGKAEDVVSDNVCVKSGWLMNDYTFPAIKGTVNNISYASGNIINSNSIQNQEKIKTEQIIQKETAPKGKGKENDMCSGHSEKLNSLESEKLLIDKNMSQQKRFSAENICSIIDDNFGMVKKSKKKKKKTKRIPPESNKSEVNTEQEVVSDNICAKVGSELCDNKFQDIKGITNGISNSPININNSNNTQESIKTKQMIQKEATAKGHCKESDTCTNYSQEFKSLEAEKLVFNKNVSQKKHLSAEDVRSIILNNNFGTVKKSKKNKNEIKPVSTEKDNLTYSNILRKSNDSTRKKSIDQAVNRTFKSGISEACFNQFDMEEINRLEQKLDGLTNEHIWHTEVFGQIHEETSQLKKKENDMYESWVNKCKSSSVHKELADKDIFQQKFTTERSVPKAVDKNPGITKTSKKKKGTKNVVVADNNRKPQQIKLLDYFSEKQLHISDAKKINIKQNVNVTSEGSKKKNMNTKNNGNHGTKPSSSKQIKKDSSKGLGEIQRNSDQSNYNYTSNEKNLNIKQNVIVSSEDPWKIDTNTKINLCPKESSSNQIKEDTSKKLVEIQRNSHQNNDKMTYNSDGNNDYMQIKKKFAKNGIKEVLHPEIDSSKNTNIKMLKENDDYELINLESIRDILTVTHNENGVFGEGLKYFIQNIKICDNHGGVISYLADFNYEQLCQSYKAYEEKINKGIGHVQEKTTVHKVNSATEGCIIKQCDVPENKKPLHCLEYLNNDTRCYDCGKPKRDITVTCDVKDDIDTNRVELEMLKNIKDDVRCFYYEFVGRNLEHFIKFRERYLCTSVDNVSKVKKKRTKKKIILNKDIPVTKDTLALNYCNDPHDAQNYVQLYQSYKPYEEKINEGTRHVQETATIPKLRNTTDGFIMKQRDVPENKKPLRCLEYLNNDIRYYDYGYEGRNFEHFMEFREHYLHMSLDKKYGKSALSGKYKTDITLKCDKNNDTDKNRAEMSKNIGDDETGFYYKFRGKNFNNFVNFGEKYLCTSLDDISKVKKEIKTKQEIMCNKDMPDIKDSLALDYCSVSCDAQNSLTNDCFNRDSSLAFKLLHLLVLFFLMYLIKTVINEIKDWIVENSMYIYLIFTFYLFIELHKHYKKYC